MAQIFSLIRFDAATAKTRAQRVATVETLGSLATQLIRTSFPGLHVHAVSSPVLPAFTLHSS
ncbi:MAG TPA: hypothetical protein VFL62_03725, partial [Bradyrhizobium sp.]|uniref:hypothetical protein n=1 Tax=Bradyrhizobium sp. TaxID=376 RepID=UPI002D80C72B